MPHTVKNKQGRFFGTSAPSDAQGRTEDPRTDGRNLRLMQDAGLNMVRVELHFPFDTPQMDTPSAAFRRDVEIMTAYRAAGMTVLAIAQMPGSFRSNGTGSVAFQSTYPAWMGAFEEDGYYEKLAAGWEWAARQCAGLIEWWQIGNEPDFTIFRGSLSHEQNVRWLNTVTDAIKKGNPTAQCGVSIAAFELETSTFGIQGYTQTLLATLYGKSTRYDYVGIDGYFGTWCEGGPEDWGAYIDAAHRATRRPVIIQEWGYASRQRGAPRSEEEKRRRFNSPVCKEKDWDAIGPVKWLGQDHSEAMQADFIKRCLEVFDQKTCVIGTLFFYWKDAPFCWQCKAADCPAETAWGVVRSDGSTKPGYDALAKYGKRLPRSIGQA